MVVVVGLAMVVGMVVVVGVAMVVGVVVVVGMVVVVGVAVGILVDMLMGIRVNVIRMVMHVRVVMRMHGPCPRPGEGQGDQSPLRPQHPQP